MPRFPYSEAGILVLANEVKVGLTQHTDIYPAPPIPVADLTTALAAVQTAMDQLVAVRAAAESMTEQKTANLTELVTILKKELRYAEDAVDGDDAKLKLLGWSARKDPTPMAAPGQTQKLVVYPQGEGWLELQWQPPTDGGRPAIYRIRRRNRAEGAWEDIVTTYECKVTLQNQPRGVELEYQAIASNKAGEGLPSNTVMVVL